LHDGPDADIPFSKKHSAQMQGATQRPAHRSISGYVRQQTDDKNGFP
jgi:hypothetical protein